MFHGRTITQTMTFDGVRYAADLSLCLPNACNEARVTTYGAEEVQHKHTHTYEAMQNNNKILEF